MTPEQQAKAKAIKGNLEDIKQRLMVACEMVENAWYDINHLEQEIDAQGDAQRAESLSLAQAATWEAKDASFKALGLADHARHIIINMERITL